MQPHRLLTFGTHIEWIEEGNQHVDEDSQVKTHNAPFTHITTGQKQDRLSCTQTTSRKQHQFYVKVPHHFVCKQNSTH